MAQVLIEDAHAALDRANIMLSRCVTRPKHRAAVKVIAARCRAYFSQPQLAERSLKEVPRQHATNAKSGNSLTSRRERTTYAYS